MTPQAQWDAVVVGGGPAGLSAALVLGRSTRRVLVLDDNRYRNAAARQVNGFLTRDGVSPEQLRALARAELSKYAVEVATEHVQQARATPAGFTLQLARAGGVYARSLVLATGITDQIPDIPGAAELFGVSIFHCPYCDGWEVRGRPLAVYGRGGGGLAMTLRTWSPDVVYFAGGPVDRGERARLARVGVAVEEEPVREFVRHPRSGHLQHVALRSGRLVPRAAVFLKTDGPRQRSNLAQQLGVPVEPNGGIRHDGHGRTSVPGLFAAGDATRDLYFVIKAAAEGAEVGVAVNRHLQDQEQAAM